MEVILMLRKLSILIFSIIFLSACVTPKITKPPEEPIDFKQYKKVKLVVFDEVKTPYSIEGMPMFEGLLKGKLQSLGYSMVEQDEDMLLETRITDFKPGSAALRFWVSFGAGKAVLIYIASFKDRSGKLLTTLDGGKSYHGLEITDNPLYKTEEEIRMGMIQLSVIQIGQFIKNNGRLE
jgi:hypothetical protein